MKLISTTLSGLILAAASVFPIHASPIQLSLTGAAEVGYSSIEFADTPLNNSYATPPNSGIFQVQQVGAGMLQQAGVAAGQFGTIQSLTETSGLVSLNASTPFLSLEGGTLNFYATSFPSGNTVGSFTLSQTSDPILGSDVVASVYVDGYFTNSLTATTQSYAGVFSATFAGYTIEQLVSSLPVYTSYSGTFAADPTPEPASLLLMGCGLVGVGFASRRKMRKA